MNDEEIIEKCIAKIKESNGVKIPWILNNYNIPVNPDIVTRITLAILKSNKYIEIDAGNGEKRIVNNPKYKNEILFQAKVAAIAGCVSILVGIGLYQYTNQKKDQSYNQLKADFQKTKKTVDSLTSLPIFRKK